MLAYSRTISIGVQKQGEDRRVVSGILEDEPVRHGNRISCSLANTDD